MSLDEQLERQHALFVDRQVRNAARVAWVDQAIQGYRVACDADDVPTAHHSGFHELMEKFVDGSHGPRDAVYLIMALVGFLSADRRELETLRRKANNLAHVQDIVTRTVAVLEQPRLDDADALKTISAIYDIYEGHL